MVHESILNSVRQVAESHGLTYTVNYVPNLSAYEKSLSSELVVYYTIDVVHEPKAFPSPVIAYRLSFHVYVKEDGSPEARWNAVQIALRLSEEIMRRFRIYTINDAHSCVYTGNFDNYFFSGFCFTFREDDQ